MASSGKHGNNNNYRPNISADGRYVVFSSDASNLVPGDTNKSEDVFVRDRLLDTSHHADLKIAITRRPIFLKPNTQGDYLYTITNNGKDAVKDVSLLHLVSDASTISLTPSQGKCSLSSIETVCHLGKLAVGKKLSLWVQIKAQNKPFNQQVIVSGAPIDTVPGNNQTLVVTYVN